MSPKARAAGWLSPYKVLDLTDERGLLAGQMLAKLGADVVQIEPPAGSTARKVAPFDDQHRSFYWSAYAAGKRSLTLDIKAPEGRALLIRLAQSADFLFESARPGFLASLGLNYPILHHLNPKLIYVSITPFGSTGPKQNFEDAELILWAAGGALHPNRDTEGPPLRISVPQAYLHAAADAAGAALIAHFARLKTQRGQHVDISVQQSVTQATLSSIVAAGIGHEAFTVLPQGGTKPGSAKTLDLSGSGARTRRSKWIVRDGFAEMHLGIGMAAGGKSNNLFAWMKAEDALPTELQTWDWITVPARMRAGEIDDADLEAARAAVAVFLANRSKAELEKEAIARKLPLAPINDVGDLLSSSQLVSRKFLVSVLEDGQERILPGRFAYGPDDLFAAPAPAPSLGQHNAAVLIDWLGLGPSEVGAYLAEQAV